MVLQQIPNSPCRDFFGGKTGFSGAFALPWVDPLAWQSAISVELALHCSPEGGISPWQCSNFIHLELTNGRLRSIREENQSKWGHWFAINPIQIFDFVDFVITPGCAIDERDGTLWPVVPSLATEVSHWSVTVKKIGDMHHWTLKYA